MPSPPRLELPPDEPPPSEPPPTYEESISQENLAATPQLPPRIHTASPASSNHHPPAAPPRPHSHRPPQGPPPQHRPPSGPPPGRRPSKSSSSQQLTVPSGPPPRKNSQSSMHSSSSYSSQSSHSSHSSRPSASQSSPYLHYPPGYHCQKCNNTGVKLSSGRTCKTCFERFGRPNRIQHGNSGVYAWAPPPGGHYYQGPPHGYHPGPPGPPGPPRVVRPGDPAIGGVLCGRCRGSGLITEMFIFEEQCPLCRGIGRLLN